ncbi:MAG: 5-formyltetrahydrofolate cyclo-ligase [Lachnospiraceae bacterium]|jgi:5-formyltetrahydrofolate cyclo-ligase|nr:5-formyltetrahydrofolate cyclo-ligase [Lachnospiraceae bacterium]
MKPVADNRELKEKLRNEIRLQRRQLSFEEKSRMDAVILQKLLCLRELVEAKAVYLYASVKGEVDTWSLMEELWKRSIVIALPRVEGKCITFYIVDNKKQLKSGSMGILEPDLPCQKADFLYAPVITPGLVFSPDGNRIGYGGGYYDRFFSKEPEHLRIGIAYPFQIKKDIKTDEQDQKIHWIITSDARIGGEK